MMRMMMIGLVACGLSALSATASEKECKKASYTLNDVTLSADGTVSRKSTILVSPPQRKVKPRYRTVIRDKVTLEYGDEIMLNMAPNTVDAILQVKVALVDKNADPWGTFFVTYQVTEIHTGTFTGRPITTKKEYYVKIASNYTGNGEHNAPEVCDPVTVSEKPIK